MTWEEIDFRLNAFPAYMDYRLTKQVLHGQETLSGECKAKELIRVYNETGMLTFSSQTVMCDDILDFDDFMVLKLTSISTQ